LVFQIKNLIKSSENRINFNIKWIRGHSGIIGNERADTMAKEGSSLEISESIYNLFPLSFAKRHFNTVTVNEWNNEWQLSTKGSQTKEFFPTIYERLKMKYFKPNYTLTQYFSGHGSFGSYLKKFKISKSDLRECEQTAETPQHIILECDIHSIHRHQLINSIHRSGHSWPPLPKLLISYKNFFTKFNTFLININN
jgi:hypothetical protein